MTKMKTALVTGAASGIGRACSEALADDGYLVFCADTKSRETETSALVPLRLDVTDERAWDKAVGRIIEENGRLDVVVNNAGFGRPAPIVETSFDSWRQQMAVNLDGVFLGTRAAMRVMTEQKRGCIINIASLASFQGTPGNAAYCAAKAGVHLLTRTAAKEAAAMNRGIRINSVHPGLIATDSAKLVVKESFGDASEDAFQNLESQIPLGRAGRPNDIAAMVKFLVSDEAAYITGAPFIVDGGWYA